MVCAIRFLCGNALAIARKVKVTMSFKGNMANAGGDQVCVGENEKRMFESPTSAALSVGYVLEDPSLRRGILWPRCSALYTPDNSLRSMRSKTNVGAMANAGWRS